VILPIVDEMNERIACIDANDEQRVTSSRQRVPLRYGIGGSGAPGTIIRSPAMGVRLRKGSEVLPARTRQTPALSSAPPLDQSCIDA
jgi:hypothetical protein